MSEQTDRWRKLAECLDRWSKFDEAEILTTAPVALREAADVCDQQAEEIMQQKKDFARLVERNPLIVEQAERITALEAALRQARSTFALLLTGKSPENDTWTHGDEWKRNAISRILKLTPESTDDQPS